VALFDLFPLNLSPFLNVLVVVLALVLAGLVLRLLMRVTRVLFTVGCVGVLVMAAIWVVTTFVING